MYHLHLKVASKRAGIVLLSVKVKNQRAWKQHLYVKVGFKRTGISFLILKVRFQCACFIDK